MTILTLKIEDLTTKINDILFSQSNYLSGDARIAEKLSVRRIRDYATKNLIAKSIKIGKEVFYTELHLFQLVVIRHIQQKRISENYIKEELNLSDFHELVQYIKNNNIIIPLSYQYLIKEKDNITESIYNNNLIVDSYSNQEDSFNGINSNTYKVNSSLNNSININLKKSLNTDDIEHKELEENNREKLKQLINSIKKDSFKLASHSHTLNKTKVSNQSLGQVTSSVSSLFNNLKEEVDIWKISKNIQLSLAKQSIISENEKQQILTTIKNILDQYKGK